MFLRNGGKKKKINIYKKINIKKIIKIKNLADSNNSN